MNTKVKYCACICVIDAPIGLRRYVSRHVLPVFIAMLPGASYISVVLTGIQPKHEEISRGKLHLKSLFSQFSCKNCVRLSASSFTIRNKRDILGEQSPYDGKIDLYQFLAVRYSNAGPVVWDQYPRDFTAIEYQLNRTLRYAI